MSCCIRSNSLNHAHTESCALSGSGDNMSLGRPALIRLTAVMPCLNEERTVATCIEKVSSAFRAMHLAGEVVIADNGSSDRSAAIAVALGARVVHVETKGY